MARFDLYRLKESRGYFLDVQNDFFGQLRTRVLVPLLPPAEVPQPIRDLHPVFQIDGQPYVMATQMLAAVPQRELGRAVGSIEAERDAITRALDLLFTGL